MSGLDSEDMNKKFLQFFQNDNATSVVIGHLLNLVIVITFTGGMAGVFYLYADSSSQQSMHTGAADLGSQIARDITNMYITSSNSKNISMTIKRDIPITLGGRGYSVELKDAKKANSVASIEISDGSLLGYKIVTPLNSIDIGVNTSGSAYSGSGEINIITIKNDSGTWIWIK